MEPARNVIVAYGLDRLLQEIAVAALSLHDWRIVDRDYRHSQSEETTEIALVFCPGIKQSIIDIVRHIHAEVPNARIVLAGLQATEAELVRFVEAGMTAYVTDTQGLADLVNILHQVHSNRTACTGRVTKLVLNNISRLHRQRATENNAQLTMREEEILHLITSGLSNKEIADHLSIAPNTVKNHIHHLLEKLQVKNRHEAAWTQPRFHRSVPLMRPATR
jgi:DNA-binding NarL/FixJ family response regulator